MPYVCDLDCFLVRNGSQISKKNPVSHISVGRNNFTTEKKSYMQDFWDRCSGVRESNTFFYFFGLIFLFLHKKTYVEGTHLKCLTKTLLMSTTTYAFVLK